MGSGTCPQCGCSRFYVKDPDDPFETREFEYRDGRVRFDTDDPDPEAPSIDPETVAYCDCCSWHDRLKTLD